MMSKPVDDLAQGISAWITCPKPSSGAGLRVFCLPHAGTGASAFRGWAQLADPYMEVWCVQLPGREARIREKPFENIDALVEAVVRPLLEFVDRPFALYGHSVGALVAFELARKLRDRHGLMPAHLFVGACPAPHIPWPHAPLRALPDDQVLDQINGRYEAIPEAVLQDAEFRQLAASVLRADFSLIETYVYTPSRPLECPISAFAGIEDRTVECAAIQAWRQHTSAQFQLHAIAGNHFFLQGARNSLLRQIVSDLGNVNSE
jgi:medium-chain acyl-[acyl-carrier-protein] hydrolase